MRNAHWEFGETPELKKTSKGGCYCPFRVITNREWNTEDGAKKYESQLHYCIAWNKLGELCAQLLSRGMLVYVEGRLRTHLKKDNTERTEVGVKEMIILRRPKPKTVENFIGKGGENESNY